MSAPSAAFRFGSPRMTGPSTPHQRLYIRCLLDELEYDSYRVTLMHRVPFARAGLSAPAPDQLLDL